MKQMALKPDFIKSKKNKMEGKLQQQGYKVTIDAAGRVASVMLVEEYNYLFSVRIVSINCMHFFLNHISGLKTVWCQMLEQSVL